MSLKVQNLSFSFGKKQVLDGVSFEALEGDFLTVLGHNGVGKSTLFRCILRMLKTYEGDVWIDGINTKEMSEQELSKKIAYIPQIYHPTFGYTVLNTVLMGMANSIHPLSLPSQEQIEDALKALAMLGIEDLADRNFAKLSGGEQQMVIIARALAQDAKILIMDEPTSALDFGNQHRILEQCKKLSSEGYTILLSTHNPQHVFHFSTKLLALVNGKVEAFGDPNEELDCELLKKMYQIDCTLVKYQDETVILPKKQEHRK